MIPKTPRGTQRSTERRGSIASARTAQALVSTLARAADELTVGPAPGVTEVRGLNISVATGYALTEIASAAAANLPELTGASFHPEVVDAAQARIEELAPVAAALRALLDRVDGEVLAQKSAISAEARRFYRLLDALEPTERGSSVAPFLDAMRRINRRFANRPGRTQKPATTEARPNVADR